MEAEGAELPAQLGDLAPGHPAQAVGGERVLDLDQLGVELGRGAVATGECGRFAGQGRPRAAEPLGDEPEALPVGLVREAPPELSIGLRQVLRIAGQARGERSRHLVGGRRGGDRLHQARCDGLIAVEDVVGVDPQGLLGDLGGHARMAVPVTADPAAPVEERPHPRRPGAAPRGVRGRPVRPAGRLVERLVEHPVEPRRQGEQRGIEEGHPGPHLVERGGGDQAQVRGPPQERDLLAQAPPHVAVLRRCEARVVETIEDRAAAPQRDQHGPPSRLGRMGGQDRRDGEVADRLLQVGVGAAEPAQLGDRVGDGVVEDAVAGGSLATAERTHPAVGLGQVDQGEVERERADHRLGRAEVEVAQVVVEAGATVRVVTAPERDHPPSDALDEREQVGARLLRDRPGRGGHRAGGPRRAAGRGRRRCRCPPAPRRRPGMVAAGSRAQPS